MKVFISVDMEGVAGVTQLEDVLASKGAEYQLARKWMTAEANAAIEGAFEAGATEVVVADSHSMMRNLLPDELHEDALLVRGSPRPGTMMEGMDESFDAAFLVGYHARAGDPKGVLSHTYVLPVYNLRLNGITVGEAGFNAAIAGGMGVPVALVCGDDALEAEVAEILPWTERVITKWALSVYSARNLSPKASCKRIREGAKRTLSNLSDMQPLLMETPIRFEVDFTQPLYSYLAADIPGVERIGGRSLAYTGANMQDVVGVWRLMINAGTGQFYV